MAFKTFTAGSVLTAADVNTYLMGQSVIACTSGTRPASPVAGMTIYETDTTIYQNYNGTTWVPAVNLGAWTSTTPTINSGTAWSLSGSSFMRYRVIGKTCNVQLYASVTAGNTAGATLWSLPLQPQNIGVDVALGSFLLRVAATGTASVGVVVPNNSGVVAKFYRHGQTTYLGQNPDNYIPATGDTITADLTYETA